jgi:hypothetical protein
VDVLCDSDNIYSCVAGCRDLVVIRMLVPFSSQKETQIVDAQVLT